LSRHRKFQISRSKAIVVAAAGALSVATAASATAATWRQEAPAHAGLSLSGTRAPAQPTAQDQAAAPNPAATQDLAAARIAARVASKTATGSSRRANRAARSAGRTPQQVARAMLRSFGWSSSQFACLKPLWAHESGWSVTAYNPGSGAYGIPQALPGSRMATAGPNWHGNAATQIRWGLRYIRGSYGSPCGAWNHELATGWY
jgi:hypothetical protein